MRRLAALALGTALAAAGLSFDVHAQSAPGKASVAKAPWKAPRNAMGQPDLAGDWTNATMTPLTRSRKLGDKATLSAAEAKVLEKAWRDALAAADAPTDPNATTQEANANSSEAKLIELRPDFAAAGGDVGGYNAFWIDPGTHMLEIGGEYRTSILTTPNGQFPPRKPGAPTAAGFGQYRDDYTSYETRSLGERCITGFGRNTGPPMLPNGYYNNGYQILQTPNEAVILVELIHDARIVRLNSVHRTDGVRPWMGDSIGHYEGDTLVIETTNFPEAQNLMGAWKNLKVTEWLTRAAPDKIVYRFQVEDPDTWDNPWGGELTFQPYGKVFEYACHEGNYALPGILAGAREKEKEEARAKAAAAASTEPPSKAKPGAD